MLEQICVGCASIFVLFLFTTPPLSLCGGWRHTNTQQNTTHTHNTHTTKQHNNTTTHNKHTTNTNAFTPHAVAPRRRHDHGHDGAGDPPRGGGRNGARVSGGREQRWMSRARGRRRGPARNLQKRAVSPSSALRCAGSRKDQKRGTGLQTEGDKRAIFLCHLLA